MVLMAFICIQKRLKLVPKLNAKGEALETLMQGPCLFAQMNK